MEEKADELTICSHTICQINTELVGESTNESITHAIKAVQQVGSSLGQLSMGYYREAVWEKYCLVSKCNSTIPLSYHSKEAMDLNNNSGVDEIILIIGNSKISLHNVNIQIKPKES